MTYDTFRCIDRFVAPAGIRMTYVTGLALMCGMVKSSITCAMTRLTAAFIRWPGKSRLGRKKKKKRKD